jgi:hypothetical protein
VLTFTPTIGAAQTVAVTLTVGASSSLCDVDSNGLVNAADVQQEIKQALGAAPATNDMNHDGSVNVLDLQLAINSVLGLGCPAQ